MRVLVVEDNEDSRELLVKQLRAYGNEVTAAANGVEALERALKSPPDILVSDILMPQMDGYQLCYEWRRNKRLKDIPFVFYTAIYTSSEDEKFALSLGASYFIRKPIEPEALAKMLSRLIEQAREGLLPAAEAPPKPSLYLTEYNERLVAKLNEKVAELEESERELIYLDSLLKSIRSINQLIVRESDKTKLLKAACTILLKVREYRFVWIGLVEEGHKRVIPVAKAGVEDSYLDSVEITWDDRPSGRGPTGTAIKTRKPDLIKNIPKNPRAATWREEALKRGYRSSAAIPLVYGDRVYGALNVCSSHPDGFNKAEVGLLVEVSSDLAFALSAIEEEAGRRVAEYDLKERMKELRCLYTIETIGAKSGLSLDDIYREVVNALPPGWQYPEITAARLALDGRIFKTKKYKDSEWKQSAEVRVDGVKVGEVEVVYLEERPESDEGPFLKEERQLIDSAAGQLARIIERRRADEALRESEEKYKILAEDAPIGIYFNDFKGTFLYGNKRAEEITGYEREELLGESFLKLKLLDPGELAKAVKLLGLNKLGKATGPDRFVLNRKGGTKRSVEIRTRVTTVGGKKVVLGMVEDITERKRAEEALRESEEKFRELAGSITDVFFAFDGDLRYTYWNKASEELTGISAQDALGKHLRDIFSDSDATKNAEKMYLKALRTQKMQSFVNEFQLRGKDHFFEINAYPSRDGLSVFVKDITERKKVEDALRESEAFQAGLLANSPIPISVMNADTSVRYVNPAMERITGFSTEELTGEKAPYCYWAEEESDEIMKRLERAMQRGSEGNVELFKRKSGERFWVEITSVPVKKDGKFQYLLVHWVDITERKGAEDALQESNKRFSDIVENSLEWIWEVDAKGKYTYVSPIVEQVLGYRPEEVLGKYFYELFHPDDREELKKAAFAAFAEKRPFRQFLNRNIHKNGEIVWIVTSGVPILDEERNLLGYRGADVDITERREAEEALRESEAFQASLLANSPTPISVVNPDNSLRYVNPALEKLTGFSAAELIGQKPPYPYWPQERRPEIMRHFNTAMRRGGKAVTELYRSKSGREIWVEITTMPVKEDGKFRYLLANWVDITERKQAEEKLRDEATRHRILIDESSDGIVILDGKGKVYEANLQFAEMLGYTLEEVRELHVWDWDVHFEREQVAEMVRTVDETGDHFETKHRRKDGTIFDVEISTNGAVYAGQKLIFCVCRDVTERKQAAAALKESEEKYKTLVEATSDIIWEVDEWGMFTFVSPRIKDILGYEVDEVVGKMRTLDLVTKGEFKKWLKRFKAINVKKEPFFGFEMTHLHKNGRPVIFEVSGIPLFDGGGNFKGFVGIDKDITGRKQMQEQLVITDRLASVGELAAGIAHELNNPLTGVIGFSQLLMDKEMPDEVRQDVQVVYGEAQRAAQVVKNLLTFARKHTAAKQMLNINDVISKVLELRAYEQRVENIKVKSRLAPDLPEIMADYFQLQQVFLNIVINAEFFMKEAHNGGTLTITTERVNGKVRASFADDGPGIAKDDLGHLFDPFFTTKEVGKGTGLGLSICHGIIAEHGGQIYVESELGKGATFIVELPISAAGEKGG
jgi:PAS domain S-box-containing protein